MKNKYRKKSFLFFFILIGSVSIVLSVLCFQEAALNSKNCQEDVGKKEQNIDNKQYLEDRDELFEREGLLPAIKIEDFYISNTGDPSNLYYIDENGVLWGCGRNEYGQLGQGMQDYDYHQEMVKIAEDVIHVDYSRHGFTIFLTKDYKLYGMGAAGRGALRQMENFSYEQYDNSSLYFVSTPVLLMEDVKYARCGGDDIVCLKEDASVWTWGTVWYENEHNFYYEKEPVKILDDVVLVTGGLFHHAALKSNGSVWTWGYNYSGNCGIEGNPVISKPQLAAEGAIMVWTGSMKYNVDCLDISKFGGIYEKQLENTIIQKSDGSYWICGAGVGGKEKILPNYYEVVDYIMICTHEFVPYDEMIN